ncbi:carbohydrate sulfotransferase 3-like isoform X1 [Haliotis rufescens]|uniref:carbohydrate sulfotransferase 3-like isoform X1 n=1 Tax=Haliotis rufescens TaxID=6454 RepID=UPI00201F5139|nr:carbohydrate sulfotransferase 3-like isoform X1 [Haliotis rufescens]
MSQAYSVWESSTRRCVFKNRALMTMLILAAVSMTATLVLLRYTEGNPQHRLKTLTQIGSSINGHMLAEGQKTMVVILTYMRSGSSFTGEIIQRSPDVFYVFEPLYSYSRLINQSSLDALEYSKTYESTLEDFLVCNLTEIDTHTLHQHHMIDSLDTMSYYFCTMEQRRNSEACLHLLEKACVRSRVSCVKTIRYNMNDMTHLMGKHDHMKILHLIRDPRPTLLSQGKLDEFTVESLGTFAAVLCNRAKRDFDQALFMKKQYPGRIATIRYEDLADKPMLIAEQMYSFIGLDLTDEIRHYIHRITNGSSDCGSYCTQRNSKDAISRWRQGLTYTQVSLIDKICQPLYRVMGYLPAQNEDHLHNLSVPLYTTVPI